MTMERSGPAPDPTTPTRGAVRSPGARVALGVLAILVAFGLLGLAVAQLFLGHLGNMADQDPEYALAQMTKLLRMLAVMLAVTGSAFAIWLGWLGYRTVRTARFPPPGAILVHARTLLEGRPATVLGAAALFVAAVLAGVSINGAIQIWRLLASLV